MPRWSRIQSSKRSTSRFLCLTRWRVAKSGWSAAPKRRQRRRPRTFSTRSTSASYFQDYLDPGYRTQPEYEESDKPSFENFLSQPTTLSDHLAWQLGALSLDRKLHEAADFIVGNLDEDGYLSASEEELAEALSGAALRRGAFERPYKEYTAALELVRRGHRNCAPSRSGGRGAHDLRAVPCDPDCGAARGI